MNMQRIWMLLVLLAPLVSGCNDTQQADSTATADHDAAAEADRDSAAETEDAADSEVATEHTSQAGERSAAEKAESSTSDSPRDVSVGEIRLTAPETWKREQPRSDFVAAEFSLPRADGDAQDGRLTISIAGGSVEANIDRWRSQFGGQPEQDSQQDLDVGGTKVTVVDFGGTYRDQAGPFAPAVERENYRMLAAIIPGSDTLYFIKAYGPQPTMAKHHESFEQFVQSLRKP